jgi:predicted deacetylase
MSARYIVRFDDVCPTMNWSVWQHVEEILLRQHVKPLLAVIPENRDPSLQVHAPQPDFWERVRAWQARGWTIGWHGYQHDYVVRSGGLIGIHDGSEFAGLPADEQLRRLTAANEIFGRHAITPRAWVAPGHSFDETTLRLLAQFGIEAVSDGFYWRPVRRAGCTWVPQQLWRFRRMPFGVWTVCFHINSWTDREVSDFAAAAKEFRGSLVPFDVVAREPAPRAGPIDNAFSLVYRRAVVGKARFRHPVS